MTDKAMYLMQKSTHYMDAINAVNPPAKAKGEPKQLPRYVLKVPTTAIVLKVPTTILSAAGTICKVRLHSTNFKYDEQYCSTFHHHNGSINVTHQGFHQCDCLTTCTG